MSNPTRETFWLFVYTSIIIGGLLTLSANTIASQGVII